jgi:hypothetical protein
MKSAHLESFIAFDNDESTVAAIKIVIPAGRLGSSRNEHFYAMDTLEAMALGKKLIAMAQIDTPSLADVE